MHQFQQQLDKKIPSLQERLSRYRLRLDNEEAGAGGDSVGGDGGGMESYSGASAAGARARTDPPANRRNLAAKVEAASAATAPAENPSLWCRSLTA